MSNAASFRDWVGSREVIVCLGPGGVGKTTTSAALAVSAALMGRRTLVLTIDPARRLANALGMDQLSHEEQEIGPRWWKQAGLAPAGSLHAMMLDTRRTCDELVSRYAPDEDVRHRIMENPLYEYVSSALVGSHDYMAMEKLFALRQERDYDLIVLDTPPASHALHFLDAPKRILDGVDNPGMERLLRTVEAMTRGGAGLFHVAMRVVVRSLSRFTGAGVLHDLAEFLLAFSSMFAGFHDRASAVLELLHAPSTAFLLVTTPQELSVREARALQRQLELRDLSASGIVLNRFALPFPDLPEEWPSSAALAKRLRDKHRALAILSPAGIRRVVRSLYDTLEEELIRASSHEKVRRELEQVEKEAGKTPTRLVCVPELEEDVHDLAGMIEIATTMGLLAADRDGPSAKGVGPQEST